MKNKDKGKDKDKNPVMKKKASDKKLREFRRSPKAKDPGDHAEPLDAESDEAEGERESAEAESDGKEGKEGKDGKEGKGKRSKSDAPPEKNGDDPGKPQTRLGLIRARHESMRREIDQIREDLESDEEE